MTIKESDVTAVAALARLKIAPEALADVTGRFGRILDMVNELEQVDTSDVAPMSNPHDAVQRLRPDIVTSVAERSALMANGPAVEDGYFLVPKVID